MRTLIVHPDREPLADLRLTFGKNQRIQAAQYDSFLRSEDLPFDLVVVDLHGVPTERLHEIAQWRGTRAGQSIATIFVVDSQSRLKLLELGASRGANLIRRPLDEQDIPGLLKLLTQRFENRQQAIAERAKRYQERFPSHSEALAACDGILDDIFGTLNQSGSLDARDIAERSGQMIDSLQESGLPAWVDAVRTHHNNTYQHCLLVTGTLLAFGHHLSMNRGDLQRLAVGGLLHDIGKADVPLSILDKPTTLTPEELTIVRQHPVTGVERLKAMSGKTAELIAFVGDHHEYLDGSGYPRGLLAENISDPVRLLTIADIFAALTERRAYKPEMRADQAIELMETMQGQIDREIFATVKSVMLKVAP